MKIRALGTSISYLPTYNSAAAPIVVGSLTSVGEITPDSEELDATTLDSAGGFREFWQGFKDSGELPLVGYFDSANAGQAKMRQLYQTGELGYFWVTFPDMTVVAFNAYVKSHTAGAAEVDGLVGFGTSLRISGLVQVIVSEEGVPQSKAAGQTATLVSTAYALTGVPTYQWKTATNAEYAGAANVSGATTATYTTAALTAGTKYYFCEITVPNHRPVRSQMHIITVT